MNRVSIEIVAESVAAAVAAERGGASRIELCSSLNEGGLTPSAGLIEAARAAVTFGVYVMIRPRAGDFCYDAHEIDVMERDIALAKRLGANGIVLGILKPDASVDIERTRQLVDLARPLEVTFHRAFDVTADLPRALDDVCATGADRLLTSGGEKTAWEGRGMIARLVTQAQGRIAIMAGSGVKPENASALVAETGVREIHASLRTSIQSPMLFRKRLSVGTDKSGSADGPEYQRFAVLEEDVRKLCHAVE